MQCGLEWGAATPWPGRFLTSWSRVQMEKEQVRTLKLWGPRRGHIFPEGGTALIIPFNFRQKWNEFLSITGTCLSPPNSVLR